MLGFVQHSGIRFIGSTSLTRQLGAKLLSRSASEAKAHSYTRRLAQRQERCGHPKSDLVTEDPRCLLAAQSRSKSREFGRTGRFEALDDARGCSARHARSPSLPEKRLRSGDVERGSSFPQPGNTYPPEICLARRILEGAFHRSVSPPTSLCARAVC